LAVGARLSAFGQKTITGRKPMADSQSFFGLAVQLAACKKKALISEGLFQRG
jgi:hypothetical protein